MSNESGNTSNSQLETQDPVAYREQLLKEYAEIRMERYEATCYDVGLDMYISSKAVCDTKKNHKAMNICIWNGCEDIPFDIVPADSVARQGVHLMAPQYSDWLAKGAKGKGSASCAITAATVVSEVCKRMNFNDCATIVGYDKDGMSYRGANAFYTDPQTKGYRGSGPLGKLIAEGKIGPGDRIATGSDFSSTGYHARTIIAVSKDKDGNVTGYIVQGNNNLELSHHSISDTTDKLNTTNVLYASTSLWAKDQIAKECENMKDLSNEEIKKLIEKEKEALNTTVNNSLNVQEKKLPEEKRYPDYIKQYEHLSLKDRLIQDFNNAKNFLFRMFSGEEIEEKQSQNTAPYESEVAQPTFYQIRSRYSR